MGLPSKLEIISLCKCWWVDCYPKTLPQEPALKALVSAERLKTGVINTWPFPRKWASCLCDGGVQEFLQKLPLNCFRNIDQSKLSVISVQNTFLKMKLFASIQHLFALLLFILLKQIQYYYFIPGWCLWSRHLKSHLFWGDATNFLINEAFSYKGLLFQNM